tara:strand:- start:332 stop:1342 length:1011 start_codon:yes stop_codon:yes gene_type:complete
MRKLIPGCMALLQLTTAGCVSTPPDNSNPPGADRNNEIVENRGADKDNWWDELPLPEWAAFEQLPASDDWFEVYRINDAIYAIYEPGQFELAISYLVVGTEKALLFDTGLGIGDMRKLVESLTDLELVVVNSHTHYDHVGGNHQFESIVGLDTAFTSMNAAGSPPAELAEFVSPGWVWKPFPAGFDREEYSSRPYKISRIVRDGDQIDIGGRVLEVLQTPGHTPDALCLIDRENRLLFTGDTFYLAPLYAHFAESDVQQFAHSARRLASLVSEVDTLLMAHNVPVASSAYLLELNAAFASLYDDEDFILTDGNREYDFGDFSIIVPNNFRKQKTVE